MADMMIRWFNGVLAWIIVVGVVLVGLAIATVNLLDREVIEEAASENLRGAFQRVATSISRIVENARGGLHDLDALEEAFEDVFELRPGIRRLELFDLTAQPAALVLSSAPGSTVSLLSSEEWREVAAGRSVAHFDDSITDRAWLITAPIRENGQVVGAIRGRFSLWKYDRLIGEERELAKNVGVGAVSITCLVFLALIRLKVHQPIHRLLSAMRRAEAGDLKSQAPVMGPSDIQEVASQYNRMLGRVRESITEKEELLSEIQSLNDSLKARVVEATSELHKTNMKLVEAQVQAERAEKLAALGELSAVVAHELGNPLSSISGHLQMLSRDAAQPAPERDRHLDIIESEIDRMVGIIQHILDSTRVQVQAAPVDLNVVISEVLALLSHSLPGRKIAVRTELTPVLPPVAGDRRTLHGMLFNLILNAIQAMPQGGTLEVRTSQARDEEDDRLDGQVVLAGAPGLCVGAVRVSVRDTGQGIPPERLGKIFEPFFTTRQLTGGTGLGLALCRRVVASSGGRLVVESVIGKGTIFTIDLPWWSGEGPKGEPDSKREPDGR